MVPIGATRVRRGCKAEPIDSFNGNKNTTNFWRRATYTAYNTRRIGRRGAEREREGLEGSQEGNEGREEAA